MDVSGELHMQLLWSSLLSFLLISTETCDPGNFLFYPAENANDHKLREKMGWP